MIPPTTAELVEAVRERLSAAIEHPVGGFEARVIANVLGIVEREIALGPEVDAARDVLLAEHGAADEAELAALIRSGGVDDEAALRRAVLAQAERRLAIDNPRWLGARRAPDQAPTIE